MQDLVRVFVYGTLKPGEVNYQLYCADRVVEVKRAIAIGELFALPFGYPAMTTGKSLVHGFLLSFANSDILPVLDRLEDYESTRPHEQNEYNRYLIETYDSTLQPLGRAWAYLMDLAQVSSASGFLLSDGWWSGCGLTPNHY